MSASVTRDRVLVLGGSGWAGRVLCELLRSEGREVHAPSHAAVDVTDAQGVARAVDRLGPRAVVNLVAAGPGAAAQALRRVNVQGADHVARAAALAGARLVHVSTDLVLDGRRAPYADDAPASPLTPYGISKADGEAAVRGAHPAATIVRTSLLWDADEPDRSTAALAARLASGEPCRLYADEIRCPLPRRTLAAAIARLLEADVAGTLNVAGREALPRDEFHRRLFEHFDVAGREAAESVRYADLPGAAGAPRPRDLTLRVDAAERLLGLRMPTARPEAVA